MAPKVEEPKPQPKEKQTAREHRESVWGRGGIADARRDLYRDVAEQSDAAIEYENQELDLQVFREKLNDTLLGIPSAERTKYIDFVTNELSGMIPPNNVFRINRVFVSGMASFLMVVITVEKLKSGGKQKMSPHPDTRMIQLTGFHEYRRSGKKQKVKTPPEAQANVVKNTDESPNEKSLKETLASMLDGEIIQEFYDDLVTTDLRLQYDQNTPRIIEDYVRDLNGTLEAIQDETATPEDKQYFAQTFLDNHKDVLRKLSDTIEDHKIAYPDRGETYDEVSDNLLAVIGQYEDMLSMIARST